MTKGENKDIHDKLDKILDKLFFQDSRLAVIDEKLDQNEKDHEELKPLIEQHESFISKTKGVMAFVTWFLGLGSAGTILVAVGGLLKQ